MRLLMADRTEESGFQETSTEVPFGEELRRERELREVSIREIADTTKISTRFLEAIEGGDFSSLPAPVFTRGFIREYANYLGLDAEEIVDRYMSIVERQERAREHEEEEMRERISGRLPIASGNALKWILIAVVAIVILGAGIYFVSMSGRGEQEAVPEEVAEPAPAEPAVDVETAPEAPPTAESIMMTLIATGDSWVDLQVDDQPPSDFTLQSGGTRTIEANEKILLRTVGNAGGVSIELNGVKVPPLGREGQVVRNVEYDLEMVNEMLRQQSGTSSENGSESIE